MLIISSINKCDTVNAPHGNGITIWFAGCSAKCYNCQNPRLQDHGNGKYVDITTALVEIMNARLKTGNKSVVLLGGEPLEQSTKSLSMLCEHIKSIGMKIYLYTGWEFHQIPNEIKEFIDWAKTGRYIEEQHVDRFPASLNQKVYEKIDNEWRRNI